jgi:alkylhydroperoxidase family enzyme
LLDAWFAFAWPLRHAAVTSRAVRELVIVRVAELLGSDYEATHHRPMAVAAGCSIEQLEHLGSWRGAPAEVFDESQRSALAVAERVALGQSVGAAEWTAFATAFSPRERVEIVLTAAFYVCVARVVATLDVPLDTDPPAAVPNADQRPTRGSQ